MIRAGTTPLSTAYTVSVDAAEGIGTGISATDRSATARALAAPESTPASFRRPGHILPIRARPGGVAERPGHAEAAVDLCRLAGLPPVGLAAALVEDDGAIASNETVFELGRADAIPVLRMSAVVTHRLFHGDGTHARVTRGEVSRISVRDGTLDAISYRDELTGAEHLALRSRHTGTRPRVSIHRECRAGDIFGSTACACRRNLDAALGAACAHGGAVIYLKPRRSRASTPDHEWTTTDDGAAAAILNDLGMTEVVLGTTDRAHDLTPGGISVVHAT